MPYWAGPCFSVVSTQRMGVMKLYWAGACCLIVISYRRMEEKDFNLGRTSLSNGFFIQNNGGKGANLGTTSFPYRFFLQKNGGIGRHVGQDLVFFAFISYRRMEEQDVISDRALFLC